MSTASMPRTFASVPAGADVIASGQVSLRQSALAPFCAVHRFRSGRIVFVQQYLSDHELLERRVSAGGDNRPAAQRAARDTWIRSALGRQLASHDTVTGRIRHVSPRAGDANRVADSRVM
jgi:hypothetical protein